MAEAWGTGSLLNTHLRAPCNPFQKTQSVDTLCTFLLLCFREPVSLGRELLHIFGAQMFTSSVPVFVGATQGDTPQLTGSDGQWVLGDYNNRGDSSSSVTTTPQGTAKRAEWSTPPVFLWKRPIGLSWSFSLRGRLLVWHTFGGLLR